MTKKAKMKFYLAHPLTSRKEVRKNEKRIEREHRNLELLNPFYDTPGRTDIKKIDRGIISRWSFKKRDCQEIVENDVKALLSSDGILAVIDGALSYGTIMEIVYAKIHHKIIVLLITNEVHRHPWLRYHSDKIIKNWDDVYTTIEKLYTKWQKSRGEKI